MTLTSFGQTIPVTGPNIGFQGTVSRFGERVIVARQFEPYTSTNNLNFGDPAVIIPNATGGVFDSVADFIAHAAASIGLLPSYWAGMAIREVKTQLTYPSNVTPGASPMVGLYSAGQMAEVLERGSATVLLTVGSPVQGSQLYVRTVLNTGNVPAGFIGDWETSPAATDLFSVEATTQTQGSPNVTVASGTNTQNGQYVSGVGIPQGTYIVSGGGTTALVLSQNATLTSAANILTFSNLFAVPGCVARTGYVDANSMLEITFERRYAA
jgi:hypothetical protein